MAKCCNYTLLVICAVGFLAVSVDIPLSWTSPNYVKLYSNGSDNPLPRPITTKEDSWIGSLVTIGAIVGPIPAPYICSKFGRKIALLAASVPMIGSFFLLAFATNVYTLYGARTLSGISLGAGYALLPIYVGEIAEDYNRGMLSQVINVFWSIGNFITYSTGPFMSYKAFNLMIAMLPTTFFILFLILGPESPYYLIAENRIEEATKSLMALRSKDKEAVQEEIESIKDQLNEQTQNGSMMDLFSDHVVRRAFITCLLLVYSQELCGFSVLFFYMQLIFKNSGSQLSDDISSLIVSMVILTSSFVSPFTVDRCGRRTLIIVSCFGMCASLVALGAFFYLLEYTEVDTGPLYWLPITSLVLFIFFFNFGMSVPWTVTAEMLPGHVKETATMIITSSGWIVAFVLTQFYNDIVLKFGMGQTFWCFGLYCFVAGIMVFLFVPETKGKSFSEIQDVIRYGGLFHFKSQEPVKKNEFVVEA